MRRAIVTLPVRVVITGGDSLRADEAQVLARKVIESGSFASAGLEGPGTHEYGSEDSPDLMTLENVECGTLIESDLAEKSDGRRWRRVP